MQGKALSDLGGTTDDDVWGVGGYGLILHWDGGSFSYSDRVTDGDLQSVHMTRSDQGWAVGLEGTIVEYDGEHWSSVTAPSDNALYCVEAAPEGTVFAAGSDMTVHRYSDGAWTMVYQTPGLNLGPRILQIAPVSANEFWVLHDDDEIMHWNGETFEVDTPPGEPREIDVDAAGNIWATTRDGLFRHSESEWEMVSDETGWLIAESPDAVWFGRNMWNGREVVPTGISTITRGIVWRSDDGSFWQTYEGRISRLVGETWVSYAGEGAQNLAHVGVSKSDRVFMNDYSRGVWADFATGNEALWSLSEELSVRTVDDLIVMDDTEVWLVAGAPDSEIGPDVLVRVRADETEIVPVADGQFHALAGDGPGNVWLIAGENRSVFERVGDAWLEHPDAQGAMQLVVGSKDRVWTHTGTSYHLWNGTQWSEVDTGYSLTGISHIAAAGEFAFVTGSGDPAYDVFGFDGATWSGLPKLAEATYGPQVLAIENENRAWARYNNAIYLWNGTSWERQAFPSTSIIDEIRVGTESLWAISDGEGILRRPL